MKLQTALIIAGAVALISLGGWISRGIWKPALDRAVAAAFDARDQVDAGERTIEGDRQTAAADQVRAADRQAAALATQKLETEIRSDPDVHSTLAAGRLGRLRDHDLELCRIRPELGGCAAPAADDPGGDRGSMSARDPAP
ncbi:MAG: hypothetical protein EBR82_20925 [Caulobacteraceae bacterium]|nr:hypothetical protein [Caulobacteraceae bacterium]